MSKLPSDQTPVVNLIKEVEEIKKVYTGFARKVLPNLTKKQYTQLSEVMSMLELHVPKPMEPKVVAGVAVRLCPHCNSINPIQNLKRMYCPYCGQHMYYQDAKQQKPKTK